LADPTLAEGRAALIITEGELDAVSAIECGFAFAVSVPDGAPPVPPGERPDEVDEDPPSPASSDQTGKFEFIFNNHDKLKRIKRFILAVDNDRPGKRLEAELKRRLSASRCEFVIWPADLVVPGKDGALRACKDLNEVLQYLGAPAVTRMLNSTKPFPVHGLYRMSDYPDRDELRTYSTGFPGADDHIKLFLGELFAVTGLPSDGKSTWVANLIVNMGEIHGWRTALYSPEMPAKPQLQAKFRRIKNIGPPLDLDVARLREIDSWIDDHIVFIDSDPIEAAGEGGKFCLDWLIDRATDAVVRHGIKMFIIDPWNEVEHARERNEMTSEYVSRALRDLKRFARQREVAVGIVAHPTKDVHDKKGGTRAPTLYDIDGGAMWFNKVDHGMVIDRPDKGRQEIWAHVMKSRFEEEAGRRGKFGLEYDRYQGRYREWVKTNDSEPAE
jgi:twinkle protein